MIGFRCTSYLSHLRIELRPFPLPGPPGFVAKPAYLDLLAIWLTLIHQPNRYRKISVPENKYRMLCMVSFHKRTGLLKFSTRGNAM